MTAAGRRAIHGAAFLLACLFASLGLWQLQRLAWKRDLIARVEARIHASPTPPPGPERWSSITAARDEYRRVRVTGVFDYRKETLVQAVTALGPGFWVMTPLRTDSGAVILINRGFVPPTLANPGARWAPVPSGRVTITGLLRISEPGGGFLRNNDPALGRWYSRDVAAIAKTRGLANAAPYFIDDDGTADADGGPVGGLTVVKFPNNHLAYALTWFGLSAMALLWGAWPAIQAAPRGKSGRYGIAGGRRAVRASSTSAR